MGGQIQLWEDSCWWSGRPSSSQMSDHCAEMNAPTKENKLISVWEIALTVSVSYRWEFASVHDDVKNAVHM